MPITIQTESPRTGTSFSHFLVFNLRLMSSYLELYRGRGTIVGIFWFKIASFHYILRNLILFLLFLSGLCIELISNIDKRLLLLLEGLFSKFLRFDSVIDIYFISIYY